MSLNRVIDDDVECYWGWFVDIESLDYDNKNTFIVPQDYKKHATSKLDTIYEVSSLKSLNSSWPLNATCVISLIMLVIILL